MIAYLGSYQHGISISGCDTTGPNTIWIDDFVYYGESLHRGIATKDILKLNGVLKVCLIEDLIVRKFARTTERKEGRESSRSGWYRNTNGITGYQVALRNPKQPFRLMLGGANR